MALKTTRPPIPDGAQMAHHSDTATVTTASCSSNSDHEAFPVTRTPLNETTTPRRTRNAPHSTAQPPVRSCVPCRKFRVLILMSDTGGGHRASAIAIASALEQRFPGLCEVRLLDLWTSHGVWPMNSLVPAYQLLVENPRCWSLLFESTRGRLGKEILRAGGSALCGTKFRQALESARPHLVISVHPLCQSVPLAAIVGLTLPPPPLPNPPMPAPLPKAPRLLPPRKRSLVGRSSEGIFSAASLFLWSGYAQRRPSAPAAAASVEEVAAAVTSPGPTPAPTSQASAPQSFEPPISPCPSKCVSPEPSLTESPQSLCVTPRKEELSSTRRVPFVTVVTDLNTAHPMWFSPDVDMCFVPTPELYTTALKEGLRTNQIKVYGLPIRQQFWEPERRTKSYIRESLGLKPDGQVVLVVGGGEGMSIMLEVVRALCATLQGIPNRVQVVVICGKNQHLFDECRQLCCSRPQENRRPNEGRTAACAGGAGARPHEQFDQLSQVAGFLWGDAVDGIVNVDNDDEDRRKHLDDGDDDDEDDFDPDGGGGRCAVGRNKNAEGNRVESDGGGEATVAEGTAPTVELVPLGFTQHMRDYMSCADLLVTKAGPGTIAEGCVAGLPLVLFSYLPGQEEGNVHFVCDRQIGFYRPEPHALAAAARTLLLRPEALRRLGERAQRAVDPIAACRIADDCVNLMLRKCATDQKRLRKLVASLRRLKAV